MNVAVVDILEGYPDEDAVYMGLFMIDGKRHRIGYGRKLMQQLEENIRQKGFKRIRLGVVEGNQKAMAFWLSLDFKEVKTIISTIKPETNWTVHVMEKYL